MKGYSGQMLLVDLSTGAIKKEKIKDEILQQFVGGRGLGAKLLYDMQRPNVDPLDKDNHIIIATGPFTGTPIPSGCKFVLVTKSPATGAFLDSYASGYIAPQLKLAGLDVLVIKGRSIKPCYLFIEDELIEIRDASHLWGLDTFETERTLKKELGNDKGVICIGLAGENIVTIAGVNSDFYRQAGRGGGGAVFGSKKLKAIVAKGTKHGVTYYDLNTILSMNRKNNELLEKNLMGKIRKRYGTPYTLNITNAVGMLPTRNFQSGVFPDAEDMIGAEAVERSTIKSKSCLGCIVACSKITEIKEGPFKGLVFEGPEYETLSMLGSNLGINYLPAIIKSNELCDRLGLDTISTGAIISFAMECYEKGLITKEDTGGKELRFGNYVEAHDLIKQIASVEDLGKLLGQGVKKASEVIGQGSEKFAMHVKGLEFPGYDPRAAFGGGLTYAVTPRGACHRRCWPASKEILENVYPYDAEGKAELVKEIWDMNTILHTLLLCDIPQKSLGMGVETLAAYYTAVTGCPSTEPDFLLLADRIETLIRMFNNREGFSRKDDTLPHRILYEPLPDGPPKGQCIGDKNLTKMLDEYYSARGWDNEGNPTSETIERLGLSR